MSEIFVKSQEHLLKRTISNPLPTTVPPPAVGLTGAFGERHIISFIGLPMRGKPFLAHRLSRYLSFFHGARCQLFDISLPEYSEECLLFSKLQAFLEEQDDVAKAQVMMAINGVEEDERMTATLNRNVDTGRIAVLFSSDEMATHGHQWSGSSKERRWHMQRALEPLSVHTKLLFIEVVVTEEDLVHEFVVQRKQNFSEEQIVDHERRIKEFTRVFVTIQEDGTENDLCYMKLTNYGERTIINGMRGFLSMRIVQFLSHLHPKKHTIYLSRHGQSTYNALHKIGGNPGLTSAGEAYGRWLGEWVPKHICGGESQRPCRLWTSSMKRTIETARHIPHPDIEAVDSRGRKKTWHQMALRVYRALDEIFAGEYEGMTYEEIEKQCGDEAILRKKDKIGYRYPRGESYFDLIARLDALMHELESYHEPILIVSHQATLRMIYAYLMGIDRQDAPRIEIPLHCVIKIEYDGFKGAGTTIETRFPFVLENGTAVEIDSDGQNNL